MARDPLSHYVSCHPSDRPSTALTLIPTCRLCGLMNVAGDIHGEWVSQRTYLTTQHVNFSDCRFTYTCCPKCCTMPALRKRVFGDSMIVTRLVAEGGRLDWLRRLTHSTAGTY